MPNIITIPNDNDPVMNSERQRIVPWAPGHGWIYTGYNNESDHIAQIRRAGGAAALGALDFDCHGAPTVFNHTNMNTVGAFGRSLAQVPGFSGGTGVYLDACNTGLTSAFGGPIAQALANAARCTVYGTKGYMTGTFAENNEQCYASLPNFPAYPGGQNANGRNVWIAFSPVTSAATMSDDQMTSGNTLIVRVESPLAEFLENVRQSRPIEFPQIRMAPDLTIDYVDDGGATIFDIYANGAVVRNRLSGDAWRVEDVESFQAMIRQDMQ